MLLHSCFTVVWTMEWPLLCLLKRTTCCNSNLFSHRIYVLLQTVLEFCSSPPLRIFLIQCFQSRFGFRKRFFWKRHSRANSFLHNLHLTKMKFNQKQWCDWPQGKRNKKNYRYCQIQTQKITSLSFKAVIQLSPSMEP